MSGSEEDSNTEQSSGAQIRNSDSDRASSSKEDSSPIQKGPKASASTASSSSRRRLQNLAFEVPEELNLATPSRETGMERKHRHQRIRRY